MGINWLEFCGCRFGDRNGTSARHTRWLPGIKGSRLDYVKAMAEARHWFAATQVLQSAGAFRADGAELWRSNAYR
jgi:hypothetical protein